MGTSRSTSEVQSRGEGVGGIAFEAVVDEGVAGAGGGSGLAAMDEMLEGGPGFFVGFFGFGVGLEIFDGLLVGAAGAEEEAGGEEVGGEGAGHLHLLFDGGHFGPAVKDVGDVVRAENVEVFGAEEIGVADFDGVLPVGRKLAEEGVERGEEVSQAREVGGVES
jgi:hypothetical protein